MLDILLNRSNVAFSAYIKKCYICWRLTCSECKCQASWRWKSKLNKDKCSTPYDYKITDIYLQKIHYKGRQSLTPTWLHPPRRDRQSSNLAILYQHSIVPCGPYCILSGAETSVHIDLSFHSFLKTKVSVQKKLYLGLAVFNFN